MKACLWNSLNITISYLTGMKMFTMYIIKMLLNDYI